MSTLTYTDTHLAPAEEATKSPRRSLWRRVYDAMVESQQRRAEREVARYVASHGGLLTDDIEREIMHRLAGNGRRLL
jgi:hypothetical protein